MTESTAPAAASRRLRGAVTATAAAIVALSLVTRLPFSQVIGLPLFYVLVPGLALAQLPLIRVTEIERTPVYIGSGFTILVLGAIAFSLSYVVGGIPSYLAPVSLPELAAWAAGLTLLGLLVLGPLSFLDLRNAPEETPILVRLLPRTRREKAGFAVLSLCAGVGEELAYRGYALAAIMPLGVGPLGAVLLSSIAFGLLHAYQGGTGVVRAGLVGALLASPVLALGSILPAVLAHAALDLIGGLVLGPMLIRRAEAASSTTNEALVPPLPRE